MLKSLSNFFQSTQSNIPVIHIDLHSHLIPGIDDGAKTMTDSVALIKDLKAFGFSKLITTPHIMHHRYPNSSKTILEGLEQLKEELARQKIDITIEAAAEYYLDDYFYSLLKQDDLLTFGDNYLLFEMSYVIAPADLDFIIYEMQSKGYRPVLAHPERYLYMHRNFDKYIKLKNSGVLFQINTNSLGGYYSKPVQKAALKLVEMGMVDLIGTDTHSKRHIIALEKVLGSKNYRKLFEKNSILNNTILQ